MHINSHLHQGPVSQKSRELFGPEKPFVKLRPAFSVKLVFSYVVKGIKIKITAKFRASRRLRFEDTKRIMSPEIRPKSFGTFEKQTPDLFNAECDNLKEIFLKLKYPEGLINSMINRFIESQDQEQTLIDIQVNKSIQIILPFKDQ